MTQTDPWAVLGVTRGCPRSEIRKAYRHAVLRTHPDRGGSAAEFRAVQRAWESLERGGRNEHRAGGRSRHEATTTTRSRRWASPPPPPPPAPAHQPRTATFSWPDPARRGPRIDETADQLRLRVAALLADRDLGTDTYVFHDVRVPGSDGDLIDHMLVTGGRQLLIHCIARHASMADVERVAQIRAQMRRRGTRTETILVSDGPARVALTGARSIRGTFVDELPDLLNARWQDRHPPPTDVLSSLSHAAGDDRVWDGRVPESDEQVPTQLASLRRATRWLNVASSIPIVAWALIAVLVSWVSAATVVLPAPWDHIIPVPSWLSIAAAPFADQGPAGELPWATTGTLLASLALATCAAQGERNRRHPLLSRPGQARPTWVWPHWWVPASGFVPTALWYVAGFWRREWARFLGGDHVFILADTYPHAVGATAALVPIAALAISARAIGLTVDRRREEDWQERLASWRAGTIRAEDVIARAAWRRDRRARLLTRILRQMDETHPLVTYFGMPEPPAWCDRRVPTVLTATLSTAGVAIAVAVIVAVSMAILLAAVYLFLIIVLFAVLFAIGRD
jgi:hypothetical protein